MSVIWLKRILMATVVVVGISTILTILIVKAVRVVAPIAWRVISWSSVLVYGLAGGGISRSRAKLSEVRSRVSFGWVLAKRNLAVMSSAMLLVGVTVPVTSMAATRCPVGFHKISGSCQPKTTVAKAPKKAKAVKPTVVQKRCPKGFHKVVGGCGCVAVAP